MATKIKRSIYIGLGGTGMTTLLHTKKLYIETYGMVPPMIGFLGIDTDRNQYSKQLEAKDGTIVRLEPYECQPIHVQDARPFYNVNKDRMTWVPEENLFALGGMMLGAGQVRTNGRFAFTVNYSSVAAKVQTLVNQIQNAAIAQDDAYELLGSEVEVHMIFSISGGTGCGTFLNMAYLLRRILPQCKINGYAVLPEVFKAMVKSGMERVEPNAYGAVMDLDYFMHKGLGSESFRLDYLRESDDYDITDRPFNSFVFVDNKNVDGDIYTRVDDLAQLLSLAMVTASGELSTGASSVGDNLEKNIVSGDMDIENKKAWAGGLGACEILYRGSELGDIYAIKAAKQIIERLQNSCEDADMIVNSWIDSPAVHIRENDGNDNVIDFLYDKSPAYEMSIINDMSNARPEVNMYLDSVKVKEDVISAKVNELSSRVKVELNRLMVDCVNKECGISTAKNVLEGIMVQVSLFMNEMKREKEDLLALAPRREAELETAIADLAEYDGKFFKKRDTLNTKAEDVMDSTRRVASDRLEIVRRNAAITFFTNLQLEIQAYKSKVDNISASILAVYNKFTSDLAKIKNRVGNGNQIFQIDLAQLSMENVDVKPADILIPDFVRSLKCDGKVYAFADMEQDRIEKALLAFTRTLNGAKRWSDTTIDAVIDKMTDQEFERMIKKAVKKSKPLFRANPGGYQPDVYPCDAYYIGVPNKETNRISKNAAFGDYVDGNPDVSYISIGGNDRIIIYRQFGVVPVYQLENLPNWELSYRSAKVNCHIDKNLQVRMERDGFSIRPKAVNDDDILEYWVQGFVFGLLKNQDGMYYMYSPTLGNALDDYWVELGKYRDDAYEQFRRYKTTVRIEFDAFLEKKETAEGHNAVMEIWDDAKANYFLKYSQVNMTKQEIKAKGFEKIALLMTKELDFFHK